MTIQKIGIDQQSDSSSKEAEQKPVIALVFGMHRSGTSSVAGLLHKLGFALPQKTLGVAEENPKGFFEPIEILEAHEDYLSDIG
ncbi:MAG: hypothetical protein AAGA30_13430, partial [Planctomycetota bacterium]